jgi:hypothetical protein
MLGESMPDQMGAEYWRKRAEEARLMAATLKDKQAQRTMLDIAKNYDQLAMQAEAIAASKARHEH